MTEETDECFAFLKKKLGENLRAVMSHGDWISVQVTGNLKISEQNYIRTAIRKFFGDTQYEIVCIS